MTESLNNILLELGYTTYPSATQGRKKIIKDDKFIGIMSAEQVWRYLKINHPNIFKFEGRQRNE